MTFRLRYITLVCLVFGCGCNYTNIPTPDEQWPKVSTTSPLSLAAECAEEGVAIPQGVVFGGVVTANDRSGNFYRRPSILTQCPHISSVSSLASTLCGSAGSPTPTTTMRLSMSDGTPMGSTL